MDAGIIKENILNRTIVKHARKNSEGIIEGAGPGIDAAVMKNGTVISVGTASKEEGIPEISVSCLAFLRAANNLYTVCDEVDAVTMSLMVGTGVTEDEIRREMISLENELGKTGACLIHGDSRVLGSIDENEIIVTINAVGHASQIGESVNNEENIRINVTKIIIGDRIVMAGYPGMFEAVTLAKKNKEELLDRFPSELLRRLSNDIVSRDSHIVVKDAGIEETRIAKESDTSARFEIRNICRLARNNGAKKLHDISNGGLYRALYNLSQYARYGVDIIHENIPVLQEIIELAEYYSLDPYAMNGTGGVLITIASQNEEALLDELRSMGIPSADIGCFTESNSKVIRSVNMEMSRNINPA